MLFIDFTVQWTAYITIADKHARLLKKGASLFKNFDKNSSDVGESFQFLACDVVMLHMLEKDREFFSSIGKSA